jgi:hypothetical protein
MSTHKEYVLVLLDQESGQTKFTSTTFDEDELSILRREVKQVLSNDRAVMEIVGSGGDRYYFTTQTLNRYIPQIQTLRYD